MQRAKLWVSVTHDIRTELESKSENRSRCNPRFFARERKREWKDTNYDKFQNSARSLGSSLARTRWHVYAYYAVCIRVIGALK